MVSPSQIWMWVHVCCPTANAAHMLDEISRGVGHEEVVRSRRVGMEP